ncbi:TRAP transporter small permease [Vibrio natriegens]|uniref:TRAP transporter small permease n=1 Tax=Vibrio natriegens TaxID=691 RepID=UPI003B59B681
MQDTNPQTLDMSIKQEKPTLVDSILKIDQIIAGSSLILIVSLMIYGVITRYIFNSPSAWVEEICLALFTWFTFMGASVLMKFQEHVNVDFIAKKLNQKAYKLIEHYVIPLVLIITLLFMTYFGFQLLEMSQSRFTPALKISYVYIYAAIPFGALLMLIHLIRNTIKNIKGN